MDSAAHEDPKAFRDMCVRLLRHAYDGEQREPRIVRTFKSGNPESAKAATQPTCAPVPPAQNR
jgi:hypothetical protein